MRNFEDFIFASDRLKGEPRLKGLDSTFIVRKRFLLWSPTDAHGDHGIP
jgi:hypothetical protein